MGDDSVFRGAFVSDQFDGVSFNATGDVQPLIARGYAVGGLWKAIKEVANARFFLGVHWQTDSYYPVGGPSLANSADAVMDLNKNVGGTKLGLDIAHNIWNAGSGIGPKLVGSPVPQPEFQ